MKILSALTLAALLSTSAAFAADAPAPAPAATPAPSAMHKGHSLKYCNKQADAKKLAGADRDAFVKECHGAKKS